MGGYVCMCFFLTSLVLRFQAIRWMNGKRKKSQDSTISFNHYYDVNGKKASASYLRDCTSSIHSVFAFTLNSLFVCLSYFRFKLIPTNKFSHFLTQSLCVYSAVEWTCFMIVKWIVFIAPIEKFCLANQTVIIKRNGVSPCTKFLRR